MTKFNDGNIFSNKVLNTFYCQVYGEDDGRFYLTIVNNSYKINNTLDKAKLL
jgi:hypothetical protein